MIATRKKRDGVRDVYRPADGVDLQGFSGQRRIFEKVDALPLRWPRDKKDRFDLFDAWHHVGMQLLHRGRGSFRLIAVAKLVIRWAPGVIIDSNAQLAERAGGCAEKTISREVQDYVDLGILIADMGWRHVGTQVVRTRSMRLALPTNLPGGITLPTICDFDLDNSCPDGSGFDLDNSGPGDLDNSGPITIDHKRGGSNAA